MANWYVSSVAYAAVETWSTLHTALGTNSGNTTLGQIITQTSPAVGSERCFRCTTVGTLGSAEPTWTTTLNATTSESGGGTAVWTECTGQEAYQHVGSTSTWTAPAARHNDLTTNPAFANGDTLFYSPDHAETQASALTLTTLGTNALPCKFICASRTSGNVPPLATDVTTGASFTTTGTNALTIGSTKVDYWYGCTFVCGSGSTTANLIASSGVTKYEQCVFKLGNTATGSLFNLSSTMEGVLFRNCSFYYSNAAQVIESSGINTPTMIFENDASVPFLASGSTTPTYFYDCSNANSRLYARGLDLSAISQIVHANTAPSIFRMIDCKLKSGVTMPALGDASSNSQDPEYSMEFINCANNNNYTHFWVKFGGLVQTNTTYTRTGGATDGTQGQSMAMNSDNNVHCSIVSPLIHDFYIWNTVTGVSKTATVELLYGSALTNAQVWGELLYLGTSGSPISSFTTSEVAPLATPVNLTSSVASWTGSLSGATPQKISFTVTPQVVGLIRFRICMAVPNVTIYVDPEITVV